MTERGKRPVTSPTKLFSVQASDGERWPDDGAADTLFNLATKLLQVQTSPAYAGIGTEDW